MKKITLFLFSLFCVLSLTVNAQDFTCNDGSTIPSSYFCDGSIDNGNASWGADCLDGSDELLSVCCDVEAPAYAGLCDGDGDGDGDGSTDSTGVDINTCGTDYLCDGTAALGNASWPADCADGSDEVLEYCCDNGFLAYVDAGLCGDSGDDSGDDSTAS